MAEHKTTGEIHPQGAYTLREFARRTGLNYGRARNHIPVRKLANRSFVLGEDFVAYLKTLPVIQPKPRSDFLTPKAQTHLDGPDELGGRL